jgi:uncharacterized protein (DUF488 family)
MTAETAATIWTIGHSTQPLADFIAKLETRRIELVADVRRFPGSRRHPQFGREALRAGLADAGIDYRHCAALGGRRRPRPDSPNTAWRNEAFRGYADHLADADYRAAFDALCVLARERHCALTCAESLWWRCHRSLIADDLALRGWTVAHILGNGIEPHAFRVPARLVDGVPRYGDGQGGLFESRA